MKYGYAYKVIRDDLYKFLLYLEIIPTLFHIFFTSILDMSSPCLLRINLDTKEFSDINPLYYIITELYIDIINNFIAWREYHLVRFVYV